MSTSNNTATTELIVDGQTFVITLSRKPTDGCPEGQHKDPLSGICVDNCLPGQTWDPVKQVCVDNNPPPPPPPPPVTGNIGPDGVMQIYPTANGGTEFYLGENPDKSKFNVSYGGGSHLPYSKKKEGSLTYFNTTGSPITYHSGSPPGRSTRLDIYPDGGIWGNKTKYSWDNNPGYLYTPKGIKSGEFTSYIRVHQDLGTHQAYAHKIGGRDEDAIRSLIEAVYPTATHSTMQINYNYAHFPYVNAKPNIKFNPPKLTVEKWVGFKTIRKVATDGKSSNIEMWVDLDPFDSNGKPKNGWKLAAMYLDKGTPGYKNIACTWACHKDLIRVDGFGLVDFTRISDREIDVNIKPSVAENTIFRMEEATQDHTVLDADPLESVEESKI